MARPTTFRCVAAIAASVALTSASCSGHSDKGSAGGSPVTTTPATAPRVVDPCVLVSLTDAGTLTGSTMLPGLGVRTDNPDDRTCTYTAASDAPAAQVEVLIGPRAKDALDHDRGLGRKITDVARVGHEAHEEDGAIFFRKKTTWVAVRVTGSVNPAVLRPRLVTLARKVTPLI